jgi:ribosome-dependent ATPase
MPRDAAIVVDAVSHAYGAVTALHRVSLTLAPGATTAVVGPDGVGKSTLLGLIAGVRRLQSGRIAVFGADLASAKARDALAPRIAYMPQGLGRNLYPTLSIAENIDFAGRLFGHGRGERAARMARLLEATGLAAFADRPAEKLSGGMRQKLSLCCALIHDPDLLILDEPTTGIDPLSRRQFWSLIDAIRRERPGMTVLVATAYMEEAERFDRIVAIVGGTVLADGTAAVILAQTGGRSMEEAYARLQRAESSPAAPEAPLPPRPVHHGPPAIVAEGLTRRFGTFTAVDRVSFRIERGEIFGFLGSNGCGKTTTMKMLTGLLPASEGRAELLGQPVSGVGIAARLRVGYMSQSFSLYEELTVRANLELHARLYRVPAAEVPARVHDAIAQFDLAAVADTRPPALPLGIRQRLQLAVACIHRPDVLILDEPTSGVDPAARTLFWRLLGTLSRRDGVTIFVSTHFMNEAERCDRISLMHAGRVLAVGTPRELQAARQAPSLEEAFVSYLQDATGTTADQAPASSALMARPTTARSPLATSFARMWAFARRETTEIVRDPVRLAFALLGPLVLLATLGYGITFDVESLPFAVFDNDRSIESRRIIESFAGSRYFAEQAPLQTESEIERRLRGGELRVAISIPPGFGRDLLGAHRPEIGFFIDGAMPFRAETARGYIEGIVLGYAADLARRTKVAQPSVAAIQLEPRFRYNQEFRSAVAITPGCIMVLLIMIPSMLTAVGVVRERELGSISNLYASPASVGEFLIGKQAPYIAIGVLSFLSLCALARILFGVTINGSFAGLFFAAALYVFASTGLGLLVSTFVRTQVAALIVTAIIATVPAINFAGFLSPAATLEGMARFFSLIFPAMWFQNVSLGAFAKGSTFADFHRDYLMLFAFGVGFLAAASWLLRKQER